MMFISIVLLINLYIKAASYSRQLVIMAGNCGKAATQSLKMTKRQQLWEAILSL